MYELTLILYYLKQKTMSIYIVESMFIRKKKKKKTCCVVKDDD
jgi:hypothetical protein